MPGRELLELCEVSVVEAALTTLADGSKLAAMLRETRRSGWLARRLTAILAEVEACSERRLPLERSSMLL